MARYRPHDDDEDDLPPLDEREWPEPDDQDEDAVDTIACPACGAEVWAEAAFCPKCGTDTPSLAERNRPSPFFVAMILVLVALMALGILWI